MFATQYRSLGGVLLLSGFYLFAVTSALTEERAPTVMVPSRDPAMAAAFAKAHATLDDFFAKLAHPAAGTEDYAVKIGIKDIAGGGFAVTKPNSDSGVEYFWVGDIQPEGQGFTGAIHNDPEVVRNISLDQKIRFERDDIADWTYFDQGKMKGNFTACPALAHSPQAMAEMKEKFGLACD